MRVGGHWRRRSGRRSRASSNSGCVTVHDGAQADIARCILCIMKGTRITGFLRGISRQRYDTEVEVLPLYIQTSSACNRRKRVWSFLTVEEDRDSCLSAVLRCVKVQVNGEGELDMFLPTANERLWRWCSTTIRAREVQDAGDKRHGFVVPDDGLTRQISGRVREALVDEVEGKRGSLREGQLL